MYKLFLLLLLLALQAKGQAILGYNNQTGLSTGSGYYIAQAALTGAVPLKVTNCFVYVGAGGTTGKQVECVITIMNTANTFNGTPQCHGTSVFGSGTINAWVTVPMPGCTLAANTNYFIGYNSNDTNVGGMTFGLTTVCNSQTCIGSTAGIFSGAGTAQYAPDACCTYPYGTTTFQGYNSYGQSVYITTAPVTTTSVQGLRKGSL